MTESDLDVTSFDRKTPGSGCRGPISQVLGTYESLQGCNLQEVAVTSQEMTSRDLKLTELARTLHHLTGSHLEVAVEGL